MNALKKNNVTITGLGTQPLIFAHGFGTDQSAWRFIQNDFEDRFKLILYDNVAAGKSDDTVFSPNKYNNLYTYANDLLDICREIDLSDAYFVGHSVSGMIGMLAAIEEPRYFSKIVMVGASPRYLNDDGYVGGFDQTGIDRLYAAMTANYYAWVNGFAGLAMGNPDRPELSQEFARTLSSIRPDIAISVAKTVFQSDYRSELPKFGIETLILQSTDDIAVPQEVGEYLHAHLKGSKLINVNSTGHLPHISAPREVSKAVSDFIR